eukprot:TRINITY_DN17317_c0_g1_i1.p1 TRINITY_DN17317_c0_g1~~TRINITY_DN17317_c0_g1_i1.p1  ORF type:complete len:462 (+),score=102.09 TRINITY_DN17317_c0_g1_i1:79-1386(+)
MDQLPDSELVLGCEERARRLDVTWGELAGRRCIRSEYEPLHLAALHAATRLAHRSGSLAGGCSPADAALEPQPTHPVVERAGGTGAVTAAAAPPVQPPAGGGRAAEAARDSLELELARLRQRCAEQEEVIEHLRFCTAPSLSQQVAAGLATLGDAEGPAREPSVPLCELAALPRAASQDSVNGAGELADWRTGLELREQAVSARERALAAREERCLLREERVAAMERRESDLEQELKELRIKEKEYKLRFRGLEEAEAQQSTLLQRFQELREREAALQEAESALAEGQEELRDRQAQLRSEEEAFEEERSWRLAELDARELQLQDARETAPSRAVGPPAALAVVAPPRPQLQGVFRIADQQWRGRPMWQCGENRIFADSGMWLIASHEEMEEGIGWIVSGEPHAGRTPDCISSWQYAPEEGADLLPAPSVFVTRA